MLDSGDGIVDEPGCGGSGRVGGGVGRQGPGKSGPRCLQRAAAPAPPPPPPPPKKPVGGENELCLDGITTKLSELKQKVEASALSYVSSRNTIQAMSTAASLRATQVASCLSSYLPVALCLSYLPLLSACGSGVCVWTKRGRTLMY